MAAGSWAARSVANAGRNDESAEQAKRVKNLQRIIFKRLSFSGRDDCAGAMLSFRKDECRRGLKSVFL